MSAVHILFLSDNFPPETNAPATRTHEHARVWVRAGHRVTVITCAPNFPEGRVFPGYRNRWRARETLDGIEVVRVKTFIVPNRGFAARVLDYTSFMLAAFVAGLFEPRPDVVVGTSPQFFAAVGAWMLAAARRRPFVFELRDLWPESIAAVGAIRSARVLRALEALELFLYRRSAAVVAVTDSFREDLARRGIDAHKIAVVRNGVDLSQYSPRPRDVELARELGVDDRFVVGYFGTHGMAHALERVLDAAEILRKRRDIAFVFAGAGAARGELVRSARERGLENVVFVESRPKEQMPALWSVCDVGLVHLGRDLAFARVIPSKIFECFGMGVPVLFAGPDGEGARIVREHGAGVAVEAENPELLASAIEFLAGDAELRGKFARASRAAAPDFERGQLALSMLAVLERCAGIERTEPSSSTIVDRRPARRSA